MRLRVKQNFMRWFEVKSRRIAHLAILLLCHNNPSLSLPIMPSHFLMALLYCLLLISILLHLYGAGGDTIKFEEGIVVLIIVSFLLDLGLIVLISPLNSTFGGFWCPSTGQYPPCPICLRTNHLVELCYYRNPNYPGKTPWKFNSIPHTPTSSAPMLTLLLPPSFLNSPFHITHILAYSGMFWPSIFHCSRAWWSEFPA